MKETRLRDVIPNGMTSGIFAAMQAKDVPWKNSNIALSLDMQYHGNRSGGKLISPIVEALLGTSATLDNLDIQALATVIYDLYSSNWTKEYNTLSAQYNPIENYSMVETMTNDATVTQYGKTHARVDNLSHAKTGTETDAPNTTETETPGVTETDTNKLYGFNSNSAVNADEQVRGKTGNNTITKTGQVVRTYNVTDADTGRQDLTEGGSDTSTRNYSLSRSGNIGVTTSQQMLQSERDLWLWNFFYNVVFPDVDKVLTIDIY